MAQLDPNLILGYKPIQPPDQLNMLMQGLQAQHLMSATQSQQMQAQQQQQSFDATNRLNAALQADPSLSNDSNRLMQTGGTYALPLVKQLLDTQQTKLGMTKTQGDIDKQKVDAEHTQIMQTGSVLNQAADAGPQAVMDTLMKSPTVPEDKRAALIQQAQADPVAFARRFAQSTMTVEQQMTAGRPGVIESPMGPVAYNKSNPNAGYSIMQPNGGQPAAQPQPQQRPTSAGNNSVDWEATLKAGIDNPDPAVRREMQARLVSMTPGLKPDFAANGPAAPVAPAVPAAAQANPFMKFTTEKDPATGGLIQVSNMPGPDGKPIVRPIDTTNAGGAKLTKEQQSMADAIAKYDLAPPGAMALHNPVMANIMAAVTAQNPAYDATKFNEKQTALRNFSPSGKAGQTMRSLSVASDHLDTLAEAGAALQNGQIPVVNKIANMFNVQTGGTAVGGFNAVKQIVGDEVVKAILGGAGGVGDREGIQKTLDAAKTPQDLANVISHYRTLMAAQREALQSDYESQTGRTDSKERFNYKAKGTGPSTSVSGAKFLGFENQ
jgi:hypothetical protein